MPLQFKNIAVGNLQDDVSGNNYAANKAVYILNLNNTLAQIFSDEAGTIPIVQDGVSNVTGAKGVFGFWVEAGDYFVQVGANKYRVSITGADYFNNRVDETVDLIVDAVAGRGAYYPVGSFEAGFTYTDINQVGTFGGNDYYIYTGGLTNLPHIVTAGTNPTSNSNYAQVFYTDHNSLTNRNAVGAHDDIYTRNASLAEAQAENAGIGTKYYITDLKSKYTVVGISDVGGYYIDLTVDKKLKKDDLITELTSFSLLPDVANNTLSLQGALNAGFPVVINKEVTVQKITIPSGARIAFTSTGKLNGVAGSKIFESISNTDIEILNPNLAGVFTTTPNLAEHAIDFTSCSDVRIINPKGRNIGGNFIRLDRCTDSKIEDIDCDNVGFLGYIAINCIRDKLIGGYVRRCKDPFSVQSKGGTDSFIDDIQVTEPHSCGVIVNTNDESGTLYPAVRPRVGRVTILGESAETPIGTKGGVLYQGTDGSIGEVYMTGNTKIPQLSIASTTDNLTIGSITVESNTSIGVDGALNVGTVVIRSLIAKGNQDRAARFLSGKISILGGEINENGIANVPNIEFVDWDDFIVSGVRFIRTSSGTTRNNMKLGVSTGTGLITANSFERNGQPDVASTTGEFRVDCPNVDVIGNRNCFLALTDGWVAEFDVQNGLVVENGYIRGAAPSTGTWVVGDTIKLTAGSGQPSRAICTASPNTFSTTGILS